MAVDNQPAAANQAKQIMATPLGIDSKASSNHVEATQNNSDNARWDEKEGLRDYDDGLDHEHEPPVRTTAGSTASTTTHV